MSGQSLSSSQSAPGSEWAFRETIQNFPMVLLMALHKYFTQLCQKLLVTKMLGCLFGFSFSFAKKMSRLSVFLSNFYWLFRILLMVDGTGLLCDGIAHGSLCAQDQETD